MYHPFSFLTSTPSLTHTHIHTHTCKGQKHSGNIPLCIHNVSKLSIRKTRTRELSFGVKQISSNLCLVCFRLHILRTGAGNIGVWNLETIVRNHHQTRVEIIHKPVSFPDENCIRHVFCSCQLYEILQFTAIARGEYFAKRDHEDIVLSQVFIATKSQYRRQPNWMNVGCRRSNFIFSFVYWFGVSSGHIPSNGHWIRHSTAITGRRVCCLFVSPRFDKRQLPLTDGPNLPISSQRYRWLLCLEC